MNIMQIDFIKENAEFQYNHYSWSYPTEAEVLNGALVALQLYGARVLIDRHDEVAIGSCGRLQPPIKLICAPPSARISIPRFSIVESQRAFFHAPVMYLALSPEDIMISVTLVSWKSPSHNQPVFVKREA